jgi:hypothetical protein
MTAELILGGLMLWTLLALVLGFALGKRLRQAAPLHRLPAAKAASPRRMRFGKIASS